MIFAGLQRWQVGDVSGLAAPWLRYAQGTQNESLPRCRPTPEKVARHAVAPAGPSPKGWTYGAWAAQHVRKAQGYIDLPPARSVFAVCAAPSGMSHKRQKTSAPARCRPQQAPATSRTTPATSSGLTKRQVDRDQAPRFAHIPHIPHSSPAMGGPLSPSSIFLETPYENGPLAPGEGIMAQTS